MLSTLNLLTRVFNLDPDWKSAKRCRQFSSYFNLVFFRLKMESVVIFKFIAIFFLVFHLPKGWNFRIVLYWFDCWVEFIFIYKDAFIGWQCIYSALSDRKWKKKKLFHKKVTKKTLASQYSYVYDIPKWIFQTTLSELRKKSAERPTELTKACV